MSTSHFIPEVWAASILENFRNKAVLTGLANRDYEGDLKAGNTVHIPGIVDIQVKDYKTGVVTKPGGGGTLLEGGVHAPVVGGRFLQAFDGLDELDVVAVGGERTEECGTVGLRGDFGEQFGDGFGVGGVAGLDFAGVRQGELVEEHGLQLFDGGEVEGFFAVVGFDGVADDGACGILRLGGTCGKGVVQFGEERVGDGDACLLHVCEDVK